MISAPVPPAGALLVVSADARGAAASQDEGLENDTHDPKSLRCGCRYPVPAGGAVIASSSRSRRLCDGVELGVRGVLFREGLDVALGDAHLPRLEPRRHRITRSVKQCSRGASRSAGPTASTSRVRGHARAHRSAGETGGRALRRWPPCSGPRAPGRAAPPRRHLAGARTTRMARPQAERYTLPPAGSISSSPPRFPAAQRGKRPPHVDEQERRRGGLDLPPSSRDRGEGRWRLGRASAGAVVDAEADVSIDLGTGTVTFGEARRDITRSAGLDDEE